MVALSDAAYEAAKGGDLRGVEAYLVTGGVDDLYYQGVVGGESMLMVALFHGQYDTAELLLKRGANPNIFDEELWTPLDLRGCAHN